jgi:hypothetical protein
MEMFYKSQRAYGDLNMCTAVCYNLAMRYLGAQHSHELFSHESIDEIMKQSAEFYRNARPESIRHIEGPNLGVFDIMKMVKLPPGIVGKDFGGTLRRLAASSGELDDVEGLVVMSLVDALQLLRETIVPAAFIATFLEHSIVFLAEAGGRVLLFDPLPASLVDVSRRDDARVTLYCTAAVVYSGVLFGHAAE